ncbi:response regulator transcription factor [Pseudonocardia zijingensis]|uniref:Response regulator transcription factor n=1 Tax=Pseudonocardia zijingensis TaxID=153376 RepID=A0ABN1N788_9PSEU
MIKVIVADDQPLVRSGLAMLLDAEPDVDIVGEAGDGAEAVDQARRLRPDVVIMDVRMPVMDGVEATRRITADGFAGDADRPVKVLILTTYHVDRTVHEALRAGASGFLLKDSAPADLIAATRAVAAGDAWLQPAVARDLLAEFAARPDQDTAAPETVARLTPRETEVLVHIARGMTNAEIAEHLHVSEVTVKTHVGRIFMKLDLRDRVHAVITAYESGLVTPRRPGCTSTNPPGHPGPRRPPSPS